MEAPEEAQDEVRRRCEEYWEASQAEDMPLYVFMAGQPGVLHSISINFTA